MQHIVNIFRGMAIGVANAIPGVSGGTIAFILGIYDKMMDAIGNTLLQLKSDKTKGRLIFLLFIGAGILLGGWGFSWLLNFLMQTEYKQPVYFLFGGLIAGSIPFILKVHKDMKPTLPRIGWLLIGAALVIGMTIIKIGGTQGETALQQNISITNNAVPTEEIKPGEIVLSQANLTMTAEANAVPETKDFVPPKSIEYLLWLFVCGFLSASAMIVPGVSGSALLIVLGEYYHVINMIANVFGNFSNLFVPLAVFGVGVIIGVIVAAKVIDFFLKRFPSGTIYFIIGLMLASFYQIWMQIQPTFTFKPLVFGLSIAALIGGFALAYFVSKIEVPETKKAEKK
ncbi:MAG: hypothetical protein A2Y33_05060 [Spirochaetes bacterium GWF1_51_8]|nr:MAG: hypothetical protein A2Y33_05060 [Spirochaetes bacterium GWF1_51_8]